MKLNDKLNNLNKYPFHMPGHKRNPKFNIPGSEIDITEIDGFDNLHSASGVLLDVENELSNIYKSKRSFMLVNGTTVGILSAIFAVCNEGDLIIVARNCHKSVYNACFLRKLKVVYIEPDYDSENGYYTALSQKTVDKALIDYPNAKCLVITSPTYEGNVSNINCNIPLVVDAAHGAHLPFVQYPAYPKGDIVVSSLHKTLPALTQSAVANIYNDKYVSKFKLYLDMFETSSPSYVIMNSVAKCVDYVKSNTADFEAYYNAVNEFQRDEYNNLKIKKVDDFGKIVVSAASTNISGVELANVLRNNFDIEVEMASFNYVVLMTSVADDVNELVNLKNVLHKIDSTIEYRDKTIISKPPCPSGIQAIEIGTGVECSLNNSIGKVSNEFIYAYPPDIPIIAAGEVITNQAIDYLTKMNSEGVNIVSDSGLFPNKILTKQI